MIIGIGTDIVEIARIRKAIEDPKTGERFRARVFTPGEMEYCDRLRRADQSYAARFAAKEAVIKVFGRLVAPLEIEVVRQEAQPTIRLHNKAMEVARELGIERWHLSLSHSDTHAIAFLIAEAGTTRHESRSN